MKRLAMMALVAVLAVSATPGTAAQVQHLVNASHTITKVDKKVQQELRAPSDSPQLVYPSIQHGCSMATKCVFGDVRSKRTVVLFGDSHAMMWLPAITRAASARQERLVLLWDPACPVANVTNIAYQGETVTPDPKCPSWKTTEETLIHKMHPVAVIVGERTAGVVHASDKSAFTRAEWQAALLSALGKLKGLRVAVLEDLVFFSNNPIQCLASYPSAVQTCATPNPDRGYPGQQTAERAAAKATGATFIPTIQWFCTRTCSPVVGDMLTYYNYSHVSVTYSRWLSGVVGTALAKVLR